MTPQEALSNFWKTKADEAFDRQLSLWEAFGEGWYRCKECGCPGMSRSPSTHSLYCSGYGSYYIRPDRTELLVWLLVGKV